jgi:hypothetical protein
MSFKVHKKAHPYPPKGRELVYVISCLYIYLFAMPPLPWREDEGVRLYKDKNLS